LLKTIPKDKRKGTDVERGVAYINCLFDLERQFFELSPQERYEKRLKNSKPVADAFFTWTGTLAPLPKSPLAKPVNYVLAVNRFPAQPISAPCAFAHGISLSPLACGVLPQLFAAFAPSFRGFPP